VSAFWTIINAAFAAIYRLVRRRSGENPDG
jgi:hypothetical protein